MNSLLGPTLIVHKEYNRGPPPRLVELASIPLKNPAIPLPRRSLLMVLRNPIAMGMAKAIMTAPIIIFSSDGAAALIIQTPSGIPSRLLANIG